VITADLFCSFFATTKLDLESTHAPVQWRRK